MDINNCTLEKWLSDENTYVKLLEDTKFVEKIPLLNVVNCDQLRDKCLVRFRGMVQDMYGPEYYLDQYEGTDKITKQKVPKRGKYVDILDEEHEVDFDHPDNQTKERQRYVAISIPALNDWVKKINNDRIEQQPLEMEATSSNKPNKRSIEEIDEQMDSETSQTASNKKLQNTAPTESTNQLQCISKEYLLNFPLPDSSGKACHLIIYQDSDSLKLNDVCEFIGFLSANPLLTGSMNDDHEEAMEVQTHHPPTSLIPRIHCVSFKKLEHDNPLHLNISNTLDLEEIAFIRRELQIVLTQLLLGDNLAAEYLIFHLISKIYLRQDVVVLGKFSLNISNVPLELDNIDFVKEFYEFIEMLMPKSHYLPMTLDNMNSLSFTPKKDYKCNRLTSGVLQLSANTHLVLDETKLSNGKLNQAGIDNVKAISNTIKDQKVPYDFNYYRLDYECDIPILIFSEGKSLLTPDFHVVLKPVEDHIKTYNEILKAAKHFLEPNLLNKIRIYLTSARIGSYELSDNVQNLIQNEFVNMRQADNKINAYDLHSLLVLARLVCLSYGKSSLDEECWRIACNLEQERKQRLIK